MTAPPTPQPAAARKPPEARLKARPGTDELRDPPFAAAWAAAVYAICTLTLAWPILGGKFLVNPHSDQLIAGYAFRDFAAQSIKAGLGFPQWNPFLFGGMPYVASMHGDVFYPTFLLRMIMPTDLAMSWGFALHLFVAGCATYAFLRAWGLPFFPSLVGGVAYMLSGQLAGLASPGHDGKLFVSALFPILLTCLIRGIRDGRHWAWGGLAIAVGLSVLSPHPQLLEYSLLASGAFALFLAFGTHESSGQLPRSLAIGRLAIALGAVVVGLAIGAIQFLPVQEYVTWSPRAGGRDYAYATSYSFPIEELFNSYMPHFSGILDKYWGRNGIHFHSEYLGAIVLFLAGGAIGLSGHKSFRRFWLAVMVVAVLWALGGSTPFYQLIYAVVPGTKFFRAPSTIYFVYAFAVAIFAAFGVQRLLAGAMSTRYALVWAAAAGAVALIFTGGGEAITQSVGRSIAASFGAPADALAPRVTENAPYLAGGAWRSFAFVALGAALVWLVAGDRIPRRVAAWALVAITAIDLWSIERLYWLFSPPASTLFASDAAIDALKAAPPGRVLAIGGAGRDPVFSGDGLMVPGIRTLLGYHGNELGRFQTLLGKTRDTDYAEQLMFDPVIWRHENVRYIYTTAPDSVLAGLQKQLGLSTPFQRLAGPVRNAAGNTVYAYRVPGDNPPAWLAAGAVRATDDQARATVTDARFDPQMAAIIPDTSAIAPFKAAAAPSGTVDYTSPHAGAIDLKISPPPAEPVALVVSENYFPGWTATVDGKPAQVTRANFNLIGVVLPAGAANVQLRFADPAYGTGKAITLIALALALLALVGGAVAGRRAPAAARA
jgi:hypothetical protein